jgi:hypothetical protein
MSPESRIRGRGRLPDRCKPARVGLHQPGCVARLPGRAGVSGEARRPPLDPGKLFPFADHTVSIRSDCLGAIAALWKESFRSPALQNIALLHNRLFMDVGAVPPLYLHVPGVVMKAEGVDDLSCSAARSRRASESTAALSRIVTSEAEERLGESISLDLFATADNTLVPRFFAFYPVGFGRRDRWRR